MEDDEGLLDHSSADAPPSPEKAPRAGVARLTGTLLLRRDQDAAGRKDGRGALPRQGVAAVAYQA